MTLFGTPVTGKQSIDYFLVNKIWWFEWKLCFWTWFYSPKNWETFV